MYIDQLWSDITKQQNKIEHTFFLFQEEAPGEDEDSESDSDDDDDDVRVTIGDIKTGAPQYT